MMELPLDIICDEILPRMCPESFTKLFVKCLYANDTELVSKFLLPAYRVGRKQHHELLVVKEEILLYCIESMNYKDAMIIIDDIYHDGACQQNDTFWNILVCATDMRYIRYFLRECDYCNDIVCNALIDNKYTSKMLKLFEERKLIPTFSSMLYLLETYDEFGMNSIMQAMNNCSKVMYKLYEGANEYNQKVQHAYKSDKLYNAMKTDRALHLAYNISSRIDMSHHTDLYKVWVEYYLYKLSNNFNSQFLPYAILDLKDIIESLEEFESGDDIYSDF